MERHRLDMFHSKNKPIEIIAVTIYKNAEDKKATSTCY